MSNTNDLKALTQRLRRIAQGTRLSSLMVPDLEDAADALERVASAAPERRASEVLGDMDSEGPFTIAPGKPLAAPEQSRAVSYSASEWASENDGGWGVARSIRLDAGGTAGSIVETCASKEDAERRAFELNRARSRAEQPCHGIEADIRLVAGFILNWFPGFEDAINWGSNGPRGIDPAQNKVYQAARRLFTAPTAEQPTCSTCTWTIDDWGCDSEIETSCGRTFEFNDGGPVENGFKFCGYCGGALVEAYTSTEHEPKPPEVQS